MKNIGEPLKSYEMLIKNMKNSILILFFLIFYLLSTACLQEDRKNTDKDNDTVKSIYTTGIVQEFDTLFFEPIKNYENDSIINNTDLKIDLLFKQTKNSKSELIFRVFDLFNVKTFCYAGKINNYDLCYFFPSEDVNLVLTENGVLLTTERKRCVQELNIDFAFGVNKEAYEAKMSMRENAEDYCVKYRFKRDYGEVYITNGIPQCGDTGHNPLKIVRKGKNLEFPYLRNILMFEYDIDQDGKKEIYLFDYACCENELTIYKIYGY